MVHEETSTDLVGRLYIGELTGVTVGNNFILSYDTDFTKKNQEHNGLYWEPVLVSDYDNDSTNGKKYMEIAGIEDKTTQTFMNEMISDFTIMATSVAKNGGFYVSRYEIGTNGSSKRGQNVLNNSESSGNMWYGLYKACRNESKNIQMIWGSQYDQIVKFIGSNAMIGHPDRDLLSENPFLSGLNIKDKEKNIYDLESNFAEWTLEAYSTSSRQCRAGVYANKRYDPIGYRNQVEPNNTSGRISTRSVIYNFE